jgi:outer membrane immunogenic protein
MGGARVDDTVKSVTGGVFAGYDVRVAERFVIGAEAGIDFGSDDETLASVAGNTITIDPKYSIDLTARTGYLVTPETLIYVRGGYANARTRTTLVNSAGLRGDSGNADGWVVGGGVERSLGRNASARLEYRYSKFEDDGDGRDARNRVLAGLSFRF